MSQIQGKPTDREKLDSLGGDPLALSTEGAPATPLDIERHRSTADAESSGGLLNLCCSPQIQCILKLPPQVVYVDNVTQLKDPDIFCHDLSTSDTCNSKVAPMCDKVFGKNSMALQTQGDGSSSSSIPPTKNVDPSVTGASAGALSTNPRHGTNRPGNQASPVDTKLSAESRGRDERVQSEDAPLKAAEKEKEELGMTGKAASAAGEVDAPDISSPPPPPQLLVIESASSAVSPPLPAVQSLPTSMPAPQAKEQKTEERPPIRHSPSLASISFYPWTSASTMSLAPLSRVQSGRSYLSENPPKKVKVKTRPESSSLQRVEEPSTKKSFLARLGFKKDVAPRTPEETKAWLRGVSPKNAGFLAQILGADKGTTKGGPPMKWDDFENVLIDLGFQVIAKKRSKVRFKPPYQGLPKSTFPKPRSGNTIDPNTLQKCGKKLKDRYGWSEMLLEHANLQSSARAGVD
ncbi:hypothetical protein BJV78DRAFT_1362509 [Lactifluus subvellereus]|nr:hypothetical protein BJV78DRAFT_1362509 [Lactifluus subvellereus]